MGHAIGPFHLTPPTCHWKIRIAQRPCCRLFAQSFSMLPSRLHTCESLILRSRDHREADRILTLLTPDLGRLDVLARGARKPASRKSGKVEPFMLVRIQLQQSKFLPFVGEVQLLNPFQGCRESLQAIVASSYACELVYNLTVEGEESDLAEEVFGSLITVLTEIDAEPDRPDLPLCWLELHMLSAAGFEPALEFCVGCGAEARPEPWGFSVAEGGILCPDCLGAMPGGRPLPLEVFKILRFLQRSTWEQVRARRVAQPALSEARSIMREYLNHTLERPLRTAQFERRSGRGLK